MKTGGNEKYKIDKVCKLLPKLWERKLKERHWNIELNEGKKIK